MGAHGEIVTFDGKLTPKELEAAWNAKVLQCLHEFGDGYNGTITTMSGVDVYPDKVFNSIQEAEEWILNNHQKWEAGLAVRAKRIVTSRPQWSFNSKATGYVNDPWMVEGGWGGKPRVRLLANQLNQTERKALEKALTKKDETEATYNKVVAEWTKLYEPLKKHDMEFPPKWFTHLKATRKKLAKSEVAMIAAKRALSDMSAKLSEKYRPQKTEDKGLIWVAGGWAAE